MIKTSKERDMAVIKPVEFPEYTNKRVNSEPWMDVMQRIQ